MVAANSQWLVPTICCTCNGNNPTITPFAIHVGQLSSCFFSTGLHLAALFQAYHSESIFGQVSRYLPNLSITRVTKAHLFSHKRITTTRWSATSHLKSVNACLWDTQHSPSSVSTMLGPEWFIKPYTKAYNTPSNGYSKCDNHYLSISI